MIQTGSDTRPSKKTAAGLMLGAIGVVFGDIGTSPLYAVQAIFSPRGQGVAVNELNIYGILSLIIWSLILVVSVKYIAFVMRADNHGEGGVLALVALIKGSSLPKPKQWLYVLLGLIGMALFFGDTTITPAISVLSAVEGLRSVSPALNAYIIPTTLVLLTALFYFQKYGTAVIGRIFGPVMVAWFLVIGLAGAVQIWNYPAVLQSLNPGAAAEFVYAYPVVAFVAMGAVILAITGAEALYTDMGHFGRKPIARAWLALVMPSLLLCYMGQGAILLNDPSATLTPFMSMFPEATRIPVIILAMLATLIASQAVISGAFSLVLQAIQLDFMPKMQINHTSIRAFGQIYVPFINTMLFIIVAALVVGFGTSEKLATAYGVAVSGTLAVDTILFLAVVRLRWRKPAYLIVLAGILFISIDAIFISANLSKIPGGGWFPLLLSGLLYVLLYTWIRGQTYIKKERRELEGPLQSFIDKIHTSNPPVIRVPGTAVYIGHHGDQAPLALHASVEKLHELHSKVVIVTVNISTAAHIPEAERAVYDKLSYEDGISHLTLSYGFHDQPDIPKTLKSLRGLDPELDFDTNEALYFISLSRVVPTGRHDMMVWQKSLYALMSRNARSTSDYYKLPVNRTEEMRTLIEL